MQSRNIRHNVTTRVLYLCSSLSSNVSLSILDLSSNWKKNKKSRRSMDVKGARIKGQTFSYAQVGRDLRQDEEHIRTPGI